MQKAFFSQEKTPFASGWNEYVFIYFVWLLQALFEPKQWDYLMDQFKQEFCRLYGMTLEPLLNIYLQAGLSALKTPYP